ncbi:protein-tyrosine-phosphatase, variant 2 [Trebouxia sp. C0010 RCD-2024]
MLMLPDGVTTSLAIHSCSGLQTVPTCQNLYKNSFHYHTVSSKPPDYSECFTYLGTNEQSEGCTGKQELLTYLHKPCLVCADSVQQEKGRVLVHCMTGASTSPSVVIGYLMRLRRWRLNESYKWVHDRRAVVSLHEGEAARLQQLEVQLLGESSTGFNTQAAQQSPGGPFAWSAWRDAPQPSPPALIPSQPFSSFGQANHPSPNNFVFGNASH